MNIDVWWIVLALCVLGAGASCSAGDLSSCDEVSWRRRGRAELTGAPQFTASLIAPGEPLALEIPVDEWARSVDVRIRRADDADTGPLPIVVLTAETDGAEIVQLPLEGTDLAPGVYFAESIDLAWDEYSDTRNTYSTSAVEMPYILSTTFHFELPYVSCQSDIPAPTFVVAEDSPGAPQ